jgi:Rrf2 family protein
MKFPAQVQYACQAMVELGLNYKSNKPVQLMMIAQAQNIPEKFLVQILTKLRNAGFLTSFRGNAGGYKIVKRPMEITLADIVRVIDPDLVEYQVALKKNGNNVSKALKQTWLEINQIISERMEAISLEDIINRAKDTQMMYYI